MNLKKFLIILIFFNIGNVNVFAIQPDVFVQSTVNRASQILSKNISKENKINELKLIAKDTVDIRGIGFYSLGSYRKSLDDNKKKQLYKLLRNAYLKWLQRRFNLKGSFFNHENILPLSGTREGLFSISLALYDII